MSRSVDDFILLQELPGPEDAVRQAKQSLVEENVPSEEQDESGQYLDQFLPSYLDLSFDRSQNGKFWVLRNPVHALHLSSQLDEGYKLEDTDFQNLALYGEEEERSMVLKSPGFPVLWHPMMRKSEAPSESKPPFGIPIKDTPAKSATKVVLPATPLQPEAKATPVVPENLKDAKDGTETIATDGANDLGASPPPAAAVSSSTDPPQEASAEPSKEAPQDSQPPKVTASSDPSTSQVEPLKEAAETSKAVDDSKKTPPVAEEKPAASSASPQPPPKPTVSPSKRKATTPVPQLPESNASKLERWRSSEDQINHLRRTFLSKRSLLGSKQSSKKRKAGGSSSSSTRLENMAAWRQHPQALGRNFGCVVDFEQWKAKQREAVAKVDLWVEYYRRNRLRYWKLRRALAAPKNSSKRVTETNPMRFQSALSEVSVFGAPRVSVQEEAKISPDCLLRCSAPGSPVVQATSSDASEWSNLYQCLECGYIGYGPSDIGAEFSSDSIQKHFLESNHGLAVSCDSKARIYCFEGGQFVSHEIFDHEKERVDLSQKLPWLSWKEAPVKRSFDALRFFRAKSLGIFWKGMKATYPAVVPRYHVQAAKLSRQRQIVFEGNMTDLPADACTAASELTKFIADAPVGMYNLGNTCFMSAVLQCMIHCIPLQNYFLRGVKHSHDACSIYKSKLAFRRKKVEPSGVVTTAIVDRSKEPCIGSEMDKLFLQYMSSVSGIDAIAGARVTVPDDTTRTCSKGDPLVISDMLGSVWRCRGMSHLAGYAQRDAQEFYLAFVESLIQYTKQYHSMVYGAIHCTGPMPMQQPKLVSDEIKNMFEGTLRSVLVCNVCGNKRIQNEPFMCISLDLSKEVKKATADAQSSPGTKEKLTVERCLRHFTLPEILGDGVDCPSCRRKTSTKKQHVVSKLPKVLCLHLKRFDAARNKKIEDFVSFPSQRLNMGSYLPHWCEVSRVREGSSEAVRYSDASTPEVLYDLFGTVNHYGNLASGHYVSNVRVNRKWYHINDSEVRFAGPGDGEAQVLEQAGAYLLFYERRSRSKV